MVPAGPKAAQAEKVRTRLLPDVDERRNSRTSATVGQLRDRYTEVIPIEDRWAHPASPTAWRNASVAVSISS